MKKFLALSFLLCLTLASFGQFQTPRFGLFANEGNTGASLTYKTVKKAFAATDSINPNAYYTFYQNTDSLRGAKTVKAKVTNAHLGDKLEMEFVSDTLAAGRVITFSTGFITTTSGGTITAKKSKKAIICFIFDGVAWIEESRSVQY